MLMRMVSSRDLGLGSNLIPYGFLLAAAIFEYYSFCVSCQPNYIMLALIIQCSTMMSMGSVLVCPKSHSTDAGSLPQVRCMSMCFPLPYHASM